MRDKHVFALETITRAAGAPPHHDPFDRMLIAQAKAENMSLITHDSQLPYYEEKCIIPV
jgi:PIN domain nuclease of toxin-antitoxin system